MRSFSLSNYLPRLGGWYIILVIAIAQLTSIPGAILGTISIQSNAEFDPQTLASTSILTPFFIILGNIILLVLAWYFTPNARSRLDDWSRNQVKADSQEELSAWREITSLTWRYGLAAVIVAYGVDILPTALYSYRIGTTTYEQFIYSLIGGLVSVLVIIIIAVLAIDHFLKPARLVLTPKAFDAQLAGLNGARLTYKFQVLILTIVTIGILLVAPVGFHYLDKNPSAQSPSLRNDYQRDSIIFTTIALGLGLGLAFFISRTVSDPLKDLISSFKAVEAGDLSQRANINATDEIAEVTVHFNRMVASLSELRETLEKQVEERTSLLKAANEIARVSSSTLDPDELLHKIINLISDQFDYYYAAIYLVDAGDKWAELKEATGEAGRVLKQNRHRLELAGRSMVAASIRERSLRVAQSTSEERQRIENPLLPYTRSEVALPLIAGDRILGALNVQSTRSGDFGIQVIETLQNMAGQVAIALENARLYQEAQVRIKEMRAIQQQYLLEGWSSLSMRSDELEYGIGERNETSQQKVTAPINLRDQIIGEITLEGNDSLSLEQKNLVDAVAVQTAVALENARLVNESRQLAIRERMLAEINSKIWSSITIDAVLQNAVKELGRRLDASSATIELKLDDTKE
jgi:GAF domain-containing protein/HAMP domain-containing protein